MNVKWKKYSNSTISYELKLKHVNKVVQSRMLRYQQSFLANFKILFNKKLILKPKCVFLLRT